jgi:hypothetical protein
MKTLAPGLRCRVASACTELVPVTDLKALLAASVNISVLNGEIALRL